MTITMRRPKSLNEIDDIFDGPGQAKLIASWAWVSLEGADFLEEQGEETHACKMRHAIEKLLILTADKVGRDVLLAEMDAIFEDLEKVH